MSILGGGGKDKEGKQKIPPGMMEDPRRIYHGNPQNMNSGAFRPVGQPALIVPRPIDYSTQPKAKKNSLMSSGRI
ncbi:MAG TPA: hypothetical protein VIM69_10615 [Opitutaceae bacterium]